MKDLKKLHPRSIVVRMPNWIGDLVMATPLLIDLRHAFPNATIAAVCQTNVASLLNNEPTIDTLFSFQRNKGILRLIKERKALLPFLRRKPYDVGILLTHSFSSAWHFFQGKITHRIGYQKEGRAFLLTHPIPFSEKHKTQHLTLTYKELLNPLGISPSSTPPRIVVSEKEKEEVLKSLKGLEIPSQPKWIGLFPGAGFGTAKCWLPDRFRQVAERLVEADPRHMVLFFGDRLSEDLIGPICTKLSKRVLNLAGKTTIRELIAWIAICSVVLTNDSGPMHLADSLGTPLIALFGSTSPHLTGPFHQRNHIIQKNIHCSPCFKRTCPIGRPCMEKIEVDEVIEAILKQLRTVNVHT